MQQPLYKKILFDLQAAIQSGKIPVGSQLPTEKELSETYQVSRITSKRALTELEQAGLIYRVRGKGSFVKSPDKQMRNPKKATRILFLLPFVNDLSVGNFAEGLSPVMQKNQTEMMMTTLEFLGQKTASEIMNEFDGLIYYALDTDQYLDLLFEFSLKNFPVVVLDKKIFELSFPTVLSANLEGSALATRSLIEEGHQKIAYLFGNQKHPQSVRQRYLGYLNALNQEKLPFHTLLDDELATNATLLEYIEKHQVTAFVCENDLVAIQAMKQLKEHNYQIPEDFSIIGFDDIQAASLVEPPLTTIAQNFAKLGEVAGKLLIDWIENNQIPEDIKIPVDLIQRKSTKEK
ncbi:GntR family transcriptional regulator of arabinose operon [Enterococcus sp. PF1-24]|uniref:GntR family transcriptional regulator n=1 Tax=unclassified Enterococcus TaxID=2608891 RepID=UPI0024732B82|nr:MULTISPECIES: substrate-binding domain-containing protein [unclassified Enterococcus]MDH6365179.1 GntR family transcriptional regulator of arabinose operon [Enterococcus sp. PFB1-1]MDH6402237.1 GntR family transcriptional regulator of arabinose operon [Enterococcus sp. PF1-24]